MSHEVESMFSARQIPWHGLGTITDKALNSRQALKAAGLNWKVTVEPIFAELADDTRIEISDQFAVVRDKDRSVLGIVGDHYTPVQNEEAFAFADALVDLGAKYETAGSLRGGKIIFLTCKIERPLVVAGDEHIPYLVVASSHDGSMSLKALLSNIRVVCMNTLNLALAGTKREFSVKHTPNVASAAADARKALGLSYQYLDAFEAEVSKLMETEMTKRQFDKLIETVFPESELSFEIGDGKETPVEQKRQAVRDIYLDDPTVNAFTGTGWGAVNAVNTWELWTRPVRVTDSVMNLDPSTVRLERQAMATLRGQEGEYTRKAHRLLVAGRKS